MKINIQIPIGISYPSIAVIPFAKGTLTKAQLTGWHLLENGVGIRSHKEIVAQWCDDSIKWLHVHGIFKGGKQYAFERSGSEPFGPFLPIPPDNEINWEIQVEEASGTVWKNTKQDRNLLINIPASEYKLMLFNNHGGWEYNGSDETKFEEIKNDFLRITRYEGWLKLNGTKSIFRYCTRVTRYSDDPLIKISHSLIFAGNMRGKKIKQISFKLNHNTPINTDTISVVDRSSYHFVLRNANDAVRVHQAGASTCEISMTGQALRSKLKSDGCITKGAMSLYVRDFWQKFPQALECNHSSMIYKQWSGKDHFFDRPVNGIKQRLVEENLHQLLHWHQGPFLENDIPKTNNPRDPEWADKYYAPFSEKIVRADGTPVLDGNNDYRFHDKEEGGYAEEFIEYTDHADMQGITIHDDIAIRPQLVQLVPMADTWNNNPVGNCDTSYVESTNASDFGAKKNDFKRVEDFIEQSILSYTDPERFKDYGRFVYGESHRNILVKYNRPSRHRIGLASYYCSGETYWRLRLRGGSDNILKLARRNTEHYRSILQTSYNDIFRTDTGDPETFGHNVAGVWYRGLWWGNIKKYPPPVKHPWPQELVSGHGGWNTRNYRVPDYDSLLWSWILDGNRYHKDGYDLWFKQAKTGISLRNSTVTSGNLREFNKMLVYGMNGYDYYHKHPVPGLRLTPVEANVMRTNIEAIGNALLNIPLARGTVGPLWQPEWIRLYAEFLVHYNTSSNKPTLVSNVLNFAIRNYNSNFHSGARTIDMASLLLDILHNKYAGYQTNPITMEFVGVNEHLDWLSRLSEKLYKESASKWNNFGVGDGLLGDLFAKLQWGAFLKRIRRPMIEQQLPEYDHYGHYPCSVQFGGGSGTHPAQGRLARGNEYRIKKTDAAALQFQYKFSPRPMNTDGSFSRAEIWVLSPSKLLPNPETRINATRFISFFIIAKKDDGSYPDVTETNYPTNSKCPPNVDPSLQHTCTLRELQQQGYYDSYSPPQNLHSDEMVINWERADPFITKNGTDEFTIVDTLDTSDKGVCKLFINAYSVYPGLTRNNLPEAMVLTNYAGSNENSGDYMFTDSKFYYRNLENRPVIMSFWASVRVAVKDTDPKWSAGAFARVKRMDPASPDVTLETYDLKYEGTGYGDEGDRIQIIIPARSVVILKIVLIYGITLVRAKIDGRILCGRTMNDVTVLNEDRVFPGHGTE